MADEAHGAAAELAGGEAGDELVQDGLVALLNAGRVIRELRFGVGDAASDRDLVRDVDGALPRIVARLLRGRGRRGRGRRRLYQRLGRRGRWFRVRPTRQSG